MVAAVPGLSTREQADVVAALVALHRRLAAGARARADGRPNGAARTPRAMSAMSATTAEAVAMPPAPGPTSVIGAMPSASMVTALVTPIDLGDRGILAAPWSDARAARCPCRCCTATPSSLMR